MTTTSSTRDIAWPPSLWAATTAPCLTLPQLDRDIDVDVVVIGGGFTGLSTALHLREAGVDVVVLEAAEPGWGASGRNNGQVIPTLSRPDPDDIVAKHAAAGERFVHLIRDAPSILFDIVRRHGLAAEAEQTGWVQPVHTPGRMKIAERRVRQWSKFGAPVEILSAEVMRDRLGTDFWHGGFWNPTGGHINPLALSRELARKVCEMGGRIFSRSPATGYGRGGSRWTVTTPTGSVRARAMVLATNAYTGEFAPQLAPQIAREVVPVLSWQLATEPLGGNLRAKIIPGRQAVSDTHGDLHFMRYDARHRLITGGALIVPLNGAERLKTRIGQRLSRIFPDLGVPRFDYVWNGYIGMTTDFMPRFHQLGPDAFAWVGCNGRAVGLSVAIGRELAAAVGGRPLGELGLPLTDPSPLPAHGLIRRVAPLRLLQFRWRDAREI